jgi:hypothetical protein
MLTASNLPPKDIELVRREIQEIREALEAFEAAVEAGVMTGLKTGKCEQTSLLCILRTNKKLSAPL